MDNYYPQKLLVGAISMALLFILMMPDEFIAWITNNFFSSVVAIFFIIPSAYAILTLKLPKNVISIIVAGAVVYIVYAYLTGMTWLDGVEMILQTIIVIVFISVALNATKNKLVGG